MGPTMAIFRQTSSFNFTQTIKVRKFGFAFNVQNSIMNKILIKAIILKNIFLS